MNIAETISFAFACGTLPVALVFVWRFSQDLWWRTWFGRSLMAIAVAIVLSTVATIMYRLYGPNYPGRSVLIVAASALAFFAMLARTAVLIHAQNAEKRTRALTEHRH